MGGGLENRPQTYENHEQRRVRREPGNRMLNWPETQEQEHQGVFPLASTACSGPNQFPREEKSPSFGE